MARHARQHAGDDATPLVQELLSGIPAGCTWLLPIQDDAGAVVDFRIAAAGGRSDDVYGRPGSDRIGSLVSKLYPRMVGGSLWQAYVRCATDRQPADLADFRYAEEQAGVVTESTFEVSVRWACGGLLVWWERVDKARLRLRTTELLGSLGWAEYDLATGVSEWSPGMYAIFERDASLGPLSRADQGAAIVAEDQTLTELAWQTLDAGAMLDTTVRFRIGDKLKSLRIMSDTARDADGTPLKIYTVVQDVTAPEASRTAMERLSEELRRRETTSLAEHRLAGQLQNMIQPIPREPFALPGLLASVTYLPAEGVGQVGGDWYHAQSLEDGQVILALGDVVGHGLTAASSMAHLRYALIAWMSMGIVAPGELLEHMNRLCLQLGTTATAIVALFDPATRRLHWADAGHPSPLLARNGRASSLRRPDGLLLGAIETTYATATTRLAPRDLVLLYTDGLVERRSSRTRLPEIRRALVSAASSGEPLSTLRPVLNEPSAYDDTCALAVLVC
jgi:serine phosphatase RsbU (regulator of sigma subunit)